MILKAKPIENKLIQDAYEEGMKIFSDFWGLNWIYNTPNIIVLESREDIDKAYGEKTQSWIRGWARNNTIHLLDYYKMATESDHNDSKEEYQAMIRHEIGHLFITKIVKNTSEFPKWLNEGISIYLANQLGYNTKPESFKGFLESSKENHKAAYVEGGRVVELLMNLFGKEKLVSFVKAGGDPESFKNIYGFDITYENINSLYKREEISANEAVEKFKEIIDKPFHIQVKHNGSIELKFPNYLLSIENGWDIWDESEDYHSQTFKPLSDEETLETFVGKTSVTGVDIVRNSIFSLFLKNGKEIDITDSGFNSGYYFRLFSFKSNEPTLALTSEFKFILLSSS